MQQIFYCEWAGGRLPSLNKWEYSAQLMEFEDNAAIEAFSSQLMRWYSSVVTKNLAAVGSTGIEGLNQQVKEAGHTIELIIKTGNSHE